MISNRAILILTLIFGFFLAKGQVSLNPCIKSESFKIVVLGSSTAAGAGPSHPDSTWVNKYRKALQQINPLNEVINLAVGGFTTYRIMPSSFVTPANRPSVDTLKNITKALSLIPDAIIVNLPSNDRQWPMQEQLANFDSLYSHSTNKGVPLYICTTQPITSSGTYQRSVRDSIIAKYGNFAIEFFMPLADANNLVLPNFAADAVHLNDSGHAVLFKQVYNHDVLIQIFKQRAFPDLAINQIIVPPNHCQDSAAMIGYVISNLGDTASPGIIGDAIWKSTSNSDSIVLQIQGDFYPCTTDTLWETNNLSAPGNYRLIGRIKLSLDSNLTNNTLEESHKTVLQPSVFSSSDTLCFDDLTQFSISTANTDTVFWYESNQDTLPLPQIGGHFSLLKDTSLYVQAISGETKFVNRLISTELPNINFNGNMFNLAAQQDIWLDSLSIRSYSTGSVPVNVFIRNGSYQGFEDSAAAWTLFFQDTLQVANSGDSVLLYLPSLPMNNGDTIGFYIHMANAGQSLQYLSGSQPFSKSTSELIFMSGVGKSFNFGSTYLNRTIAAEFHYSYGFNRLGECASDLIEVSRIVSKEQIEIRPDTVLPFTPTIVNATSGYVNYVWYILPQGDTISNSSSAIIDSSLLPMNTASQVQVVCAAEDRFGCWSSDTSIYTLLRDFSLEELAKEGLIIYPNPSLGTFTIKNDVGIQLIEIWDLRGQLMRRQKLSSNEFVIDITTLKNGLYLILIKTEKDSFLRKIEKI